jgi:hypothetical protein
MKRYEYHCTLLSEVVITASSATEGFRSGLDYLPGAKFLGIVARSLYDTNNKATLDLFHSGKVRYGDAHPLLKGQRSLPVPFDWFQPKGAKTGEAIYLQHCLDRNARQQLSQQGIQLEQMRSGYFTAGGLLIKPEQNFAIRSAYDPSVRRAKDESMFGYFALPAGSRWAFVVEDDTGQHAEAIREVLEGRHRVGRSRSAEYGLVEIAFAGMLDEPSLPALEGDTAILFAESNLCFYDDAGQPSLQPTAAQLGFGGEAEIDWDRCQLRTRTYQSWNGKRFNRNADRLIIQKGSVFVLKKVDPHQLPKLKAGLGAHREEGFGRVLLNPGFLQSGSGQLELQLRKADFDPVISDQAGAELAAEDQILLQHLQRRWESRQEEDGLQQQVSRFVVENQGAFAGVSASQWGMIRRLAKQVNNPDPLKKLLFDSQIGMLYRGKLESKWRKNNRRGKLEAAIFATEDPISFTIKLASEMAKTRS